MKKMLLGTMLRTKLKMRECVQNFLINEEGDTNFISIMLIAVVVLAIAVIFKKQLTAIVNNVFTQLTSFVGGGDSSAVPIVRGWV
jgi:Flp pilus assembly pilin Flp